MLNPKGKFQFRIDMNDVSGLDKIISLRELERRGYPEKFAELKIYN